MYANLTNNNDLEFRNKSDSYYIQARRNWTRNSTRTLIDARLLNFLYLTTTENDTTHWIKQKEKGWLFNATQDHHLEQRLLKPVHQYIFCDHIFAFNHWLITHANHPATTSHLAENFWHRCYNQYEKEAQDELLYNLASHFSSVIALQEKEPYINTFTSHPALFSYGSEYKFDIKPQFFPSIFLKAPQFHIDGEWRIPSTRRAQIKFIHKAIHAKLDSYIWLVYRFLEKFDHSLKVICILTIIRTYIQQFLNKKKRISLRPSFDKFARKLKKCVNCPGLRKIITSPKDEEKRFLDLHASIQTYSHGQKAEIHNYM